MDRDYLAIGRVTKPHGIRGDVKITLFAGVPVDLGGIIELRLLADAGLKEATVKKIRLQGRSAILTLDGVNGREEAESLVGAEIQIARKLLPPPGDAGFFWQELVGLDVFVLIASGRALGRVADIFAAGAGDIIVVRGSGHEYLIPARQEFVAGIDIPGNRVVISPPEGLLELYEG